MAIQTIITQISYSDEYSVLLGGPPTNNYYVQMDIVLVGSTSSIEEGKVRFASDSIYTRPTSSSSYTSEILVGLSDSIFIGGDSTFQLEFGETLLPLQRRVRQVPHIASNKVYWS
jgi:hypothetical protein